MKPFIRLATLGAICVVFLILATSGMAAPPADHTASEHGFMHANDKDLPYSSHCTDCHAPDLGGGLGPSCYQCHVEYWNPYDYVNAAPPLDHTIIKGGFARHKAGYETPLTSGCIDCHGENLDDGFAPSCFSCHEAIWGGGGPPADHTELKGGYAEHKPGFAEPLTNGCTQCHGPNLDDGFAPSCFTCHGAIWAGSGPPADHTEVKGGYADHKPGFAEPLTNGCTQCHGPNLDDGFAPSCFTCHGAIWAGGGPPADHTEVKGGSADHKPGFGNPVENECTQCHGPNLNDGFAPSCFTCHGQIWAGGGPPADHTDLKGGFAEHKPGYGDPLTNECTQCHGPNLDDGFAPSCFTCHGAIWGGGGPPADHTEVKGGSAEHKPGFGNPVENECTQCHGPNLDDGFAPSCFTCHGQIWAGGGPPTDHTDLKGGFAEHKPGYGDPLTNECTQCHGPNLDDGFAPSCFTCHGAIWGGGGPPADHTEVKGGSAEHKPGFGNPVENECTQCHGPNLDDGFAPSCFTCHGQIWAGGGSPTDHTDLKGGFAEHKPGYGDPLTNECTQCHGPNLDDGFAPSCFTCHGAIWGGGGPPADHTEVKGGFADHKPGSGNPIQNECTQCHGPNLDDGFAPSCFTCHEQIWAGGGPPSDHTELKMGFAEHKPGFEAPFVNGCTQCHGPNLNDGFAFSCFLCHGPIWGGNAPPNVDAGGPYAGVLCQPVQFDASGTVDPDQDILTYQWDFGDGSPLSSPGENPTASHIYADLGSYTAVLIVTDDVNQPVSVDVAVEISDLPPPTNTWTVTTTASPPETFSVTFTDYAGSLVGNKDDGSLSFGVEFVGVIFWMEIWMDHAFWGTGDTFFGNIDREAGTMSGLVFDEEGGVASFTGSANP